MKFIALLCLLSFSSYATGQTGAQSGSNSGPTLGNVPPEANPRRRNIFFPPPDRLSPTRKPILANYGKPTSENTSRMPLPARVNPNASTINPSNDDYLYYEYYDYYYDDDNSTQGNELHAQTQKAKDKRLDVDMPEASASPKLKNVPSHHQSKYEPSSFRYTTPEGEQVATRPSQRLPIRKDQSTKAPELRFRFTIAEKPDRPKRLPAATHTRHRETKLNLADLLAQLRSGAQNSPSSSNDLDSSRRGRILNKTRLSTIQKQPSPQRAPIEVAVSYTTDSSFSAYSLDSNKSTFSNDTENLSDNIVEINPKAEEETAEINNLGGTIEGSIARMEGKRVLDEKPSSVNLPSGEDAKDQTVIDELDTPLSTYLDSEQTSNNLENSSSSLVFEDSPVPPYESRINESSGSLNYYTSDLPLLAIESSSEPTLPDGVLVGKVDSSKFLPHGFNLEVDASPEPITAKAVVDISSFLPAGYTAEHEVSPEPITAKAVVDITSLLPARYAAEHEVSPEPITAKAVVDISSFLPAGYTAEHEVSPEPITVKSVIDISAFLPAGYKAEPITAKPVIDISAFLPAGYTATDEIKPDIKLASSPPNIDISNLLPKNYKPQENNEQTKETDPSGIVIKTVDISSFLPKGFKPSSKPEEAEAISPEKKNKPFDISSLLPKDFLEKQTTPEEVTQRTLRNGLVFAKLPSRPPTTTTTEKVFYTIPPIKPKVINVFDRLKDLATMEFSAAKINAKIQKDKKEIEAKTTSAPSATTTTTSTTTTTTTTTTTVPPAPTTPGVCGTDCRLSGSLRITNGAEWQPELANRDTHEFKILANEIRAELDSFYRSSSLAQWYEYVEIDSFFKGSVIVSYVLFLSEIRDDVDTIDLKDRMNEDMKRLDHSLGKFTLDPKATDFIVMPEESIFVTEDKQNFLIPEWLIAVIVIGLASFLFIVIFGVVALVSRARVKKRTNIPLKEEFLNNLNAIHAANGVDNYAVNGFYDMETIWNEKFPAKDAKKPPSSRGKGYNPEYNVNIYDSWKTDYSDPYSCSTNNPKRRPQLEFDGKQFYDDDPYNF